MIALLMQIFGRDEHSKWLEPGGISSSLNVIVKLVSRALGTRLCDRPSEGSSEKNCWQQFKDGRALKFPRTDFFKTFTAGRI